MTKEEKLEDLNRRFEELMVGVDAKYGADSDHAKTMRRIWANRRDSQRMANLFRALASTEAE